MAADLRECLISGRLGLARAARSRLVRASWHSRDDASSSLLAALVGIPFYLAYGLRRLPILAGRGHIEATAHHSRDWSFGFPIGEF